MANISVHPLPIEEEISATQQVFPERTDDIEEMITPDFLERLKWDSDDPTLQEPEEIYKNKSRVCNEALLQSEQPIDVFMNLFPISL